MVEKIIGTPTATNMLTYYTIEGKEYIIVEIKLENLKIGPGVRYKVAEDIRSLRRENKSSYLLPKGSFIDTESIGHLVSKGVSKVKIFVQPLSIDEVLEKKLQQNDLLRAKIAERLCHAISDDPEAEILRLSELFYFVSQSNEIGKNAFGSEIREFLVKKIMPTTNEIISKLETNGLINKEQKSLLIKICGEIFRRGLRNNEFRIGLAALQKIENIGEGEQNLLTNSINVMLFSILISNEVGNGFSSEESLVMIGTSGLFHDAGYSLINPELFTKEGKLTPKEKLEIQSHTLGGLSILSNNLNFNSENKIPALVSCLHHEPISGNGEIGKGGYGFYFNYKNLLKAITVDDLRTAIHISALIGLSDKFNAIISERPHRKGLDISSAILELFNEMKENMVLSKWLRGLLKFLVKQKIGNICNMFKPGNSIYIKHENKLFKTWNILGAGLFRIDIVKRHDSRENTYICNLYVDRGDGNFVEVINYQNRALDFSHIVIGLKEFINN